MKRLVWLFVVVVGVGLLLVVAYFGERYYRGLRLRTDHPKLPPEIVEQAVLDGRPIGPPGGPFDVDNTIEPSRFVVKSVDQVSGDLVLEYAWPIALKGAEVHTRMACKLWDVHVVSLQAKSPRLITTAKMLSTMSETAQKDMLLDGICSDHDCNTLVKGCTLLLNQ